jgi:hypothetical protein
MNLVPHLIALGCLTVGLIAFLYYRYTLTSWEDDTIHVREGEEDIIATQEVLAKKLGKVDLIAKIYIAIVVIYGLTIGAIYSYLQLPS